MWNIKNLLVLKNTALFAAILWTFFIFFICLIKSSSIPSVQIKNIDKVVHLIMYFVFTIVWFLTLKTKYKNLRINILLGINFLISMFYGIAIELLQEFCTTSRRGDVTDVIANCLGAILGVIVLHYFNKKEFLDKLLF
jgi:VanZ family protein